MNIKKIMKHVVERLNWYEGAILRGEFGRHECHGCGMTDDTCSKCPFACYSKKDRSEIDTACRPSHFFYNPTVTSVMRQGNLDGRSLTVDHYKKLRTSCKKWAKKNGYELNLAEITTEEYNKFIKGEV